MTHPDPLQSLRDRARERVDAAADDPRGRYRLREQFYQRWGFADRGVLNPIGDAAGGSHWWRAVNTDFLYITELAGLIAEAGQGALVEDSEIRYGWIILPVPRVRPGTAHRTIWTDPQSV